MSVSISRFPTRPQLSTRSGRLSGGSSARFRSVTGEHLRVTAPRLALISGCGPSSYWSDMSVSSEARWPSTDAVRR
jgi:hypothetical protein